AKACADAGAELAFSYQGEALKKRVDPLAASVGSDIVLPCDVGDEGSIDALFAALEERWGNLDFIVHAIGFSDKNELRGRYVDTTRGNFLTSMDISVYSFTAVVQRAEKMMTDGGSCLTLTYYGAEKVMPHYNVMGVAKAALEASVRYLAEDLGKDKI
ncbi:SDR family NAD(P)-dependent oxidoreductase, partial [Halomonas litopenaei]|nr:SDR family NAD(P)-dependent oxidoreductase [Halomonas litopenaei]